jgi:CheY-like chemotaxis protein
MPRLLLVDDNPSIHRIAESLLAPTDVELVCVDSAAEALDRIEKGERFDVALVDTAMPGMDGWTLLTRLRAMEATAHLPIALMAGVLDPVDPAKLAKAPIQGFLKKPIELRELGDRVKALLATPMHPAPEPSMFATVPATPARELVRMAEAHLPEFRHEAAPEPAPNPAPAPEAIVAAPEAEDDLLVLTAEDLWPEEAPVSPLAPQVEAPVAEVVPEVSLELEELDFDSLQELAVAAPPSPPDTQEPAPSETSEDILAPGPVEPEPVAFEPIPEPSHPEPVEVLEPFDPNAITFSDFEGLEPLAEPIDLPPLPVSEPQVAASAEAPQVASHPEPYASPLPEPVVPVLPEPVGFALAPVPAAGGQAPAASGQGGALPAEQAQAVLQALLADPVLVDALVKAVVARMGDQVIREIAWEVMPELAGRLQR